MSFLAEPMIDCGSTQDLPKAQHARVAQNSGTTEESGAVERKREEQFDRRERERQERQDTNNTKNTVMMNKIQITFLTSAIRAAILRSPSAKYSQGFLHPAKAVRSSWLMYMPRGGLRFERSAAAAAAAALCAARFEGVKLSGPEMGRRLPVRLTKEMILKTEPKGKRKVGGHTHKQTNEGDWVCLCVCVCVGGCLCERVCVLCVCACVRVTSYNIFCRFVIFFFVRFQREKVGERERKT